MVTAESIRKLAGEYYQKALAYYLHFEASERRLPQDVRQRLRDTYGHEKFMPVINWVAAFGVEAADSDMLDQQLNAYLETEGVKDEPYIMPRDRFKNHLWNKARKEGQKILSSLSSDA